MSNLYNLKQFADLLGVRPDQVYRIVDVGDIQPHQIHPDHRQLPFSGIEKSMRFSDADIEVFEAEFRRRRFVDFKAAYADVLCPQIGPAARDLEFRAGWTGIVSGYCDSLRMMQADGYFTKLVWGKEKFGALRLSADATARTVTKIHSYRLGRLDEWARRKSLTVCQECGEQGRLRWGGFLATLCDRHMHLVGQTREEDGIILDADRQRLDADCKTIHTNNLGRYGLTHAEIGLNEGVALDPHQQFRIDFAPFLASACQLPDTDADLTALRSRLLDVDRVIGARHGVEFKLTSAIGVPVYTVGFDPVYKFYDIEAISDFDLLDLRTTIDRTMADLPIDRTEQLRVSHADLMAVDCKVLLDAMQFDILKAFLQDIRHLGDGLDFVLERCEDYRAAETYGGYGLMWDNGGSDAQDDGVERLISALHRELFLDREINA